MSSFFTFLHNDPSILTFNTYFAQCKAKIDVIKIEQELEQKIHQRVSLSSVRMADDIDYNALRTMLVNNSIDSQILRSRLSHMRIEVYKTLSKLTERLNSLKKYLLARYKNEFESYGLKTQADKSHLVDSTFLHCDEFLIELTTLKDSLLFLIEDLDKNSYTLKNLVEVLSISFKNRTNI